MYEGLRHLNMFLHSKKRFRVECWNIFYLHTEGTREVDGSKMLEEKIEEFLKKLYYFLKLCRNILDHIEFQD
ncbi:hypothetical protein A7311_13850 [Paenibacillus polymyxa]|nr:hypothetical protein A7311_13850 [Paenibacillus polymyxa]